MSFILIWLTKISVQQVNVTKKQFCVSCLRKKNAIWPGIIQQPVNAGSHRIGVKTRLCCNRKSRAACAQSFAPRQQATIEIMHRNLSYYCLLAPRICIFVIHAHPVRGESHNQRNTTGEVATTSPPFYNEPHRSHVLCVKAELGTTSTSWSQHHFVAIGNPERHVRKALHRGSKQQ